MIRFSFFFWIGLNALDEASNVCFAPNLTDAAVRTVVQPWKSGRISPKIPALRGRYRCRLLDPTYGLYLDFLARLRVPLQ